MAAACEISSVFSNYFSALYSPDDPAPGPPPPAGDLAAPLSPPPPPPPPPEGPEKTSWSREQPQFWSRAQVLDWVSYQVERHQVDATTIDLSRCDMDGAALCGCSPEQLRLAFGPLGDQLYAQLWDLSEPGPGLGAPASSFPDELSWIIDLLEQDSPSFQDTLGDPGPFDQGGSPFSPETPEDRGQPSPCLSGGYGAGALSPGSSDGSSGSTAGTGASRCSRTSDSGCSSDADLDARDSRLFSGAAFPDDDQRGDPKHAKRKRGRPRKLSREARDGADGRKAKHAPRGTHLWEFIRDILLHPELHEGLMRWEDRREGVFRFLRSEAVAQLWGQKKKNSSMTYEKLSRAMRYYYKREILERVDGRRLVYKFGRNSSGWREEEEEAGSRD